MRLKKDGPLVGGRQVDLGDLEDDVTGIEIIRYTAPIVQVKPVDEEGNVVDENVMVFADSSPRHEEDVRGSVPRISKRRSASAVRQDRSMMRLEELVKRGGTCFGTW